MLLVVAFGMLCGFAIDVFRNARRVHHHYVAATRAAFLGVLVERFKRPGPYR
jgi:hypothetical protein